jgi:DNA-binding YbaB/EbfC family protein
MRALADEWSACAAPSATVNYSGGVQPGGPNMAQLMQQAQKMQQQLVAAQEELAAAEVTGTAGGGVVTAVMSGTGELRSITIDPSVLDPDDAETVQDLVVAAVHDAARRVADLSAEKMGPLSQGLNLPGLDLPGL